jgi:hypothetical protein
MERDEGRLATGLPKQGVDIFNISAPAIWPEAIRI